MSCPVEQTPREQLDHYRETLIREVESEPESERPRSRKFWNKALVSVAKALEVPLLPEDYL